LTAAGAYTLLTTDPKDLERLIYKEAGAFIGRSAGDDYTAYFRAAANELANGSGAAQTVRF
jgi:hypothetical protein